MADLPIVPFGRGVYQQYFGQLARRVGPGGTIAAVSSALALLGSDEARQLALTVGRSTLRQAYQLAKRYGGRALEKYRKPSPKAPYERKVEKKEEKRDDRALLKVLKFIDFEASHLVVQQNTGDPRIDPNSDKNLAAIPVGDGVSTRDGRQILVRSIHVRGQIYSRDTEGVSPPAAESIRLVVLLDKRTNQAQYSAPDLYQANTSSQIAPFTFRNLLISERFTILYIEYFEMIPQTLVKNIDGDDFSTGGLVASFNINIDVNIIVNHSGTSSSISDVTDNSFHIYCDSTDTGNSHYGIDYVSRVRYLNK